MTAMGTTIRDAAHLHVVPDGTIITWLRIPGDQTSEAVAFVRREVENLGPCGPYDVSGVECGQKVTVWISPGGWDPQTIESAGVNFPCQVIRWGDVSAEQLIGSEIPALVETLESGGAWNRGQALECAVRLFADNELYVLPRNGEGPQLGVVLDTAERFEQWLERDTLADALNTVINAPSPFDPVPQYDAVTQRKLDHAAGLRAAVDTLRECREEYGGQITSDAAIHRMLQLADILTTSAERDQQ
jgi:hypothetical protein